MNIMKGDLHCHTRLSDGSEGIENVISMAKKLGLDFIAITDHDTIASVSRVKVLGERYGIKTVSGVELSCYDYKRNRRVHMLCYMPNKPVMLEVICAQICDKRKKVGKELIAKTMKYFPITADDVMRFASHSTSIYKQHIMHALMCYSYTSRIFGGLYNELFNPKTGKIYVPVQYPDVYEILELINQAEGMAVLAHPYEYESLELLEELGEKNLIDGVEVYHSRCEKQGEDELIKIADKYSLVKTGGSDFHGYYSSKPCPLGSRYTTGEALAELEKRHKLKFGK